jgi:hypothetical protein
MQRRLKREASDVIPDPAPASSHQRTDNENTNNNNDAGDGAASNNINLNAFLERLLPTCTWLHPSKKEVYERRL